MIVNPPRVEPEPRLDEIVDVSDPVIVAVTIVDPDFMIVKVMASVLLLFPAIVASCA